MCVSRYVVFAVLMAAILIAGGCNSKKQGTSEQPSSTSKTQPASVPPSDDQANEIDACKYLSAADAQSIEGAPMQRSSIPKHRYVCRYDEVSPKAGSMGPAILSLTINQGKTVDDENRPWANLKEVRHLQAGEKNVAVVSGLGDEAYFTGNTAKGKVGVASVIVRKGKYNFELDSMVLEYRASPQQMKAIAKRIAGELQ